jgi:hypothetical protein
MTFVVSGPVSAQKLYRWVDSEGVVHYGDRVPPEYASQDRSLLNAQGVTIGFEEGEITAEEQAELDRLAAIQAAEQQRRADAARRDKMLLDTYLTVADIEDLRDRRLELIDSQIRVTEFYLGNLRNRLESLELERQRFAPLSANPDAPPLPEDLARDISRIEASISLYEQTLSRTRDEQVKLRDAFALDIERFRELKGG